MRLELLILPGRLVGPGSGWGWLLAALGFAAALGIGIAGRRDLRALRDNAEASDGLFLLLAFLTALTPVVSLDRFPDLPFRLAFTPLMGLPYLIWGARWGPGALAWVGLLLGGVAGILIDGRVLHVPWIVAMEAALIGGALAQNWIGRPFRLLRQPLVVAVLGWLVWLFFNGLSWATVYPSWWEALDGVWTLATAVAMPSGVGALLSGLIAQAAHHRWPILRQTRRPAAWPPYARRIQIRFLAWFGAWIAGLILALFGGLLLWAIHRAESEWAEAMEQQAERAAERLAHFLHTGDTLLADLAVLGSVPTGPSPATGLLLRRLVQTGPVYNALLVVDGEGEVVAAYPAEAVRWGLSTSERSALAKAWSARVALHTAFDRLPDGRFGISFLAPLEGDPPPGILIGRAWVEENPALQEVLASLQGSLPEAQGLVIDREGRIFLHSDVGRLGEIFPIPPGGPAESFAFARITPRGTVEQIWGRRLTGTEWWAVIRYPRAALIRRSVILILPLGALLLGLAGVGAISFGMMSRPITRRLERLTSASVRMARGDLEDPIPSEAVDELGVLAAAMEQMRHALRSHLKDLSLLLALNQRLAEAEGIDQGLPAVAHALEQAVPSSRARILIQDPEGRLRAFTAQGEDEADPADAVCWAWALEHPLPLWGIRKGHRPDLPDVLFRSRLDRSLALLPIRGEGEKGIAWLLFDPPHRAVDSERQLVRLILDQAAGFLARVRLYETVRAERERFRAVLESSPDAILLFDPKGDLRFANPAAERLLGLSVSKALGQPAASVLHDGDLLDLLREPVPPGQIRSREISRADGRAFWAGRCDLRLEDGREVGCLLLVRDITPFKELDRLKSDFIAAVSHDLRSPLTAMRGFVTMLGLAGPLTARQQEYVEKIMGGIDQMTRMINDLLDLRRIEEGVGQRALCRLRDVVRDVFQEMRPHAMARGLRMAAEIRGQGMVLGDAAWLRRAIANLVDNAIKYTPEGGSIRLGLEEREDTALVWVQDTGIGIAPADQLRIFEKFYRVRRKETAHVKGTGLGLALVRSIVEWHGGRVWVESQLGRGSTFYIAIPLAPRGSGSGFPPEAEKR